MSVGFVCLFEIMLNVAASATYLVSLEWTYGFTLCHVNSYFMEVSPAVYTLILLALTIDRVVALRNPAAYKKAMARPGRHKCFVICYWILAAAACCPLLFAIESWPFPTRLSCQVMDHMSLIYGLLTGSVCYLLCWMGMIVAMLLIQRYITSEKKRERREMRGQQQQHNRFSTHTMLFLANRHILDELRNVMLVSAMLIMYLLMLAPYLVRVKVDQIMQARILYSLY